MAWRSSGGRQGEVRGRGPAPRCNLVHTVDVASLPAGPLWLLHGFVSSAFLLAWWWRLRDRDETPDGSLPEGLQGEDAVADDVLAPVGQPTG